ncbi:MAG: putative capsular polysaccharide synthesis family protein [Actinomycetota bacterium]
MRAWIQRQARRSYGFTKWRLLRRLERQHSAPAVVVFSMGKVASTAVVGALQRAGCRPVYKIHLLLPENVRRAEERYRRTDPTALPRHILHASHVMRHLPTPAERWLVVSVVRDPVMRSVSEFFQSGARLGRLHDETTTRELLERFCVEHGIPGTIDWFERELEPTLGIDVYEHPFDPASGFTIIDTPAVKLLVLRQESLAAAPRALSLFLGLDRPVEVPRENVASDKSYAGLYESVVAGVRLPHAALDLAYDSRFARHFYSPAEIEAMRARWT